jgi:pyridinium-3,5-bisthiocarboxylic acid mononucleotide nickel chelatase
MARILYFDCASGASGDMLLGALLDLGLPLEALEAQLRSLPVEGYRLDSRRVKRGGISATKLDVVVDSPPGGHSHRGVREIREILAASGLESAVRARAQALFERLAEVEAGVHGTSTEDVHFHEVGAIDSIVDVVGSVWGLAQLGVSRFVSSPLNLGSGSVRMSHGTVGVPPPATARLVEGVPVYGDGEGELLTPTGALVVTAHAEHYGGLPEMRIERTGYGAGHRDPKGRPNVLRLIVGESEPAEAADADAVLVLECEIDDMTPELLAPLVERLLEAGALDAYLTPILMKKARPGFLVTVIAGAERAVAVEERLFSETSTLGVRRQTWARSKLGREVRSVETGYGPVRVKLGHRGGRVYNAQPEFEDCRRLASERDVAAKDVWAAALAAYHRETTR